MVSYSEEGLFYWSDLIDRERGFVKEGTLVALRDALLLFAGSGAIGSNIIDAVTRGGAMNTIVADPDLVTRDILSRQIFFHDQVGNNKAFSAVDNQFRINPFGKYIAIPEGITESNIAKLVQQSDVVIDALDVRAIDRIWELHLNAQKNKKPVVIGYDLAGTAMIVPIRYDLEGNIEPLYGKLTTRIVDNFKEKRRLYEIGLLSEADFLNFIYKSFTGPINPLKVPYEQLEEIIHRDPNETQTFQLGSTSRLVGSLAVEAIRQILTGQEVKGTITVDIPSAVRKSNLGIQLRRPLLMIQALRALNNRN